MAAGSGGPISLTWPAAAGEPEGTMDSDKRHAFCSVVLAVAPAEIARLKAIIESYDNLATLRTEDPRNHYLRLYFGGESAAEVNALLDTLAGCFSLRRIQQP
jgi:hypothetical protein